MKVTQPDLYTKTRNGDATFEEVDAFFRFAQWRDENEPEKQHRIGEQVESWWRYVLGTSETTEMAQNLQRSLMQYGVDESHIIPYFCDMIDGFFFP